MIRGLNKLQERHGLGYVMSSYTSHPEGFEAAERQATEIAAALTEAGLVVFVPIVYGPPVERHIAAHRLMTEEESEYVRSHEMWMPICERFLNRCDYGVVALTPGWHRSKGIAMELLMLCEDGRPVYFYEPEARRILMPSEIIPRWGEEFEALIQLSAEHCTTPYLKANMEHQISAYCDAVAHAALQKALEVRE